MPDSFMMSPLETPSSNLDAGIADDIPKTMPTADLGHVAEHNVTATSTPAVYSVLDTVTKPRSRQSMHKTATNATTGSIQQGLQSSPLAARPAYRRSPSKGPRRSIDGRPLIRNPLKLSVRSKPRSSPPTSTTNGLLSMAETAAPMLSSSKRKPGTFSSPRKVSSSARKGFASPRKPSGNHLMQTRDNELPHGVRPGTSRAAGGVKLAHSVSVRLRRKPRPLAVSSNPETSSSSSTTASPAPAPIAAHPEEATLTANDPTGAETVTDHNTPPLQDEHPPKPEPQITESERLAESWRDLRQREKYLKQKEEALLLGQMRLKQERAAFEMEKCRFNEEQQQRQQRRAPREDESRRKRTSRHSRSQSRPRSKVLPDDSWRRDHRSGKIKDDQQQQHQQDRHSSWSSINSNSTASPSPFPSDSESTTTATTHSTNSFSTRKSTPEHCTWSSPNASLAASYARYKTNWARLSLRSPSIPYPSPNHTSAELRQTSHLPLSVGLTWSSDDIIKYNATCFFLIAHGVPVVPDLVNARPKIGFSGAGLAEDGLKGLVREVRGELRRWHEDGLKYRSGGEEGCGDGAERKVNEELVRDETARAVFRAFTELRDGLQAEIRWRRENGVAVAAGDETRRRRRRREEKESDDVEREGVGAGREMDWTVLSEAIL